MSRAYKTVDGSLALERNEALPDTNQRLQVSILGSPWTLRHIDEAFQQGFPEHRVDYTIFGSTAPIPDGVSARHHNGTPQRITDFGVVYDVNGSHRTYDDLVIDDYLSRTTRLYWQSERVNKQSISDLTGLEDALESISLSRLGDTNRIGRHQSPYQRDHRHARRCFEQPEL